jgi:hypothetical protein
LGLNAGYYLRPSNMAGASHTKQDKRQEKGRGQEMKEYLLDQYEQEITPEIDDLIKMKEEEEGNENA